MLYLVTSPGDTAVEDLLDRRRVGLISQPNSNPPRPGWLWAADNGCFSQRWNPDVWLAWLGRQPRAGALFATVPDVLGDAAATLELFAQWRDTVWDLRYPVALVAQDGLTVDAVPFDELDVLFVGGSLEWKWSEAAHELAVEARRRRKWVHVGRINSGRRFRAWANVADSCDGSFLSYGPRTNVGRLTAWLDHHDANPQLKAGA